MERWGYLESRRERLGKTERKLYKATPLGKRALKVVRAHLEKLRAQVGRSR